jgi:hypothetical protein
MDKLLLDAAKMAANFEMLAKTFASTDIRALRTGVRPSDAMLDRTES